MRTTEVACRVDSVMSVRNRYPDVHADVVSRLRRGWLRARCGPKPIWTAMRLLMAVMDGLSIQWLLDPDFDMTGAVNRFADLLKSDLSADPD